MPETTRLQALMALTAELADTLTVEDVGEVVVGATVTALGAEAGTLALLEPGGRDLLIARASDFDAAVFGADRISLDTATPTAEAVRTATPVVLGDLDAILGRFPAVKDRIAGFHGSRVAIPLEVGGRVIGAYGLTFAESREFDRDEVDFMLALAGPCAQALERARLFAAERSAQLRLAFLAEASRVLSESLDAEELLRRLNRLVVPRLAEWCAVDLGEGDDARRVAVAGATADEEAAIIVPLRARERTLGSLAMATTTANKGIIEELARRAAMALDNARLYAKEHEAAETLQRSLLPTHLPDLPGMTVAAAYQPGSSALEVGGDWYDVFPLAGGRVGLVIGDVVGRGLRAAAAMGQLRNALRAYALEDWTPAAVLERLNQLTQSTDQGDMATLVYATFDPQTAELVFASAGHPPPLVVEPGGETEYLEGGRSVPTGVVGDTAYEEARTTLGAGATLVLYTDGLVERRGTSLDDGLATLAQAAAEAAGSDVGALRDHLLVRQPPCAGDDVAVLVFRPLAGAGPRFEAQVPAEPAALAGVRHRMRHWLTEAGASADEVHDVLLACGEACANVVEHAYGPADATFEIRGRLEEDAVVVEVHDTGRWRPPRGSERGHGMGLMRALMDDVAVLATDDGTEVRLRRRLEGVGV
jgi:GAF domain-containing protein/anti-sigma regulatory factor (Ser/Thr protein kinase)